MPIKIQKLHNKSDVSIYIHWPFCVSKCPYCDFNSHVLQEINHDEWLRAYKNELDLVKNLTSYTGVKSIFFGGGTPSLMPPSIMEGIISHINDLWGFSDNVEISMEANPNSTDISNLQSFKSAGINRLSLGIQSLIPEQLKFLGRAHSKDEALAAIKATSKIFDNYSFDLIYARPEQSVKNWEVELNEALEYIRYHLSLYQLTIEPNTAFASYYRQGKFELPDEDTSIAMYEKTAEVLDKKGIMNYEISNYAKPGYECRHNLTYWEYKDYIGIGPGAHGRLSNRANKQREVFSTRCHRAPELWLKRALSPTANMTTNFNPEKIFLDDAIKEKLLMNLRLQDGVRLDLIEEEFRTNIWHHLNKNNVEYLVQKGLLNINEIDDDKSTKLLLSKQGVQQMDGVLRYILY